MALLANYLSELKKSYKSLNKSVCRSFIRNYQKLETTKISFSRWIDK